MLETYRATAVLAWQRALKSWPLAFSVVIYAAVLRVASQMVAPLGIVGGFALSFGIAACTSGYLYFLSQAVNGQRLSLGDLKRSFGALFWDVVSVMFALWVLNFAVQLLVRGAGSSGQPIAIMAGLTMAFFFNPVPELIYQGQSRSFQLLMDAGRFMLANPVAWFLPNVLFAAALLTPAVLLPWWSMPLVLLLLHLVMVFRGLLFRELVSGGPRRRAWQQRSR